MSCDSIETRTAIVRRADDRLLRFDMRAGATVELADARELAAATRALMGATPSLVLVDLRQLRAVTREARIHLANPDAGTAAAAVALLVKSPVSRMIGNFFLGVSRASYPTRVFDSEQDALDWLAGHRRIAPAREAG